MHTELDFVRESNAELLAAIETEFRAKRITSSLILTYTLIDAIGWLSKPNDSDTVKTSFTLWVDTWLTPKFTAKGIDIRSLDLYAARCGILHRISVDSDLTEAQKARRFLYYFGSSDPAILHQTKTSMPKYHDAIILKLETFWECLIEALEDFDIELQNNAGLQVRIARRQGQRYKFMEPESFGQP